MSNQRGWRPWGDHPAVVIISTIAALLAIFTFLSSKGSSSQSQGQTDSTTVAEGETNPVSHSSVPTDISAITSTTQSISPTETSALPTETSAPPTETSVPPTRTKVPTATPVPNTEPDSVLEVGETWRQDGAELTLKEVEITPYAVKLHFYFTNQKRNEISIRVLEEYFSAVDNNGRKLGHCFNINGCWGHSNNAVVAPGETVNIGPWGIPMNIEADTGDPNLTEITVTVTKVSGIIDARWKIPIYH